MTNNRGTNDPASQAIPSTASSLLIFCCTALALLLASLFVGGQPWAMIILFTLAVQALTDQRFQMLLAVVPACGWLLLFRATGNRELFFPYTIYLAAHISLLLCRRSIWLGAGGGILVVGAFLGLRFLQHATWHVLAVEFGVAAGILGLLLVAYTASPKNIYTHVLLALAASGLAYLGLSI